MRFISSAMLIALCLAFSGCERESERPAKDPGPPPNDQTAGDAQPQVQLPAVVSDPSGDASAEPSTGQKAKTEIAEATEASKQYLGEQKDKLLAAAEVKLQELDAQTAELKAKFAEKKDEWSTEAKADWHAAMEQLEEKKLAARARWQQLKEEHGDKWEQARQGLDTAVEEARSFFDRMKQKLTGDPPPPAESTDSGPSS